MVIFGRKDGSQATGKETILEEIIRTNTCTAGNTKMSSATKLPNSINISKKTDFKY